jgi:hypothetical protein
MQKFLRPAPLTGAVLSMLCTAPALSAQHEGHMPAATDTARAPADTMSMPAHPGHEMFMTPLGGGWSLMGMAQVFPVVTAGAPGDDGPLRRTEAYATQPAVMLNVESPGSALTLRTTLNFEGWTQPDGELTFGGWGEGFIDKRHPHTILHELMLSLNGWELGDVAASLSAGRGFAPYGTDDPMARPIVKYPTNHHLSQILERWTVNGVVLWRGWSLEAGLFGGAEPTSPYDLSNIESFGDSWSVRTARRFGDGSGPSAEWEVSASYARVSEEHDGVAETTALRNIALRHDATTPGGRRYALIELSNSQGEDDDERYFSILGETLFQLGPHQPYARVEYATRPEYPRETGEEGFFRYDHDEHPVGATRWLIPAVGYGYTLTGFPFSARPFVEAQYHFVSEERGGIDPEVLFGRDSFAALSLGVRLFIGGDPMRMGSYGILDPMSASMRTPAPMSMRMGGHAHE